MTGPRTALRRGETGFVAPDGQVWEVPVFPCPQVVVGADYAEIDGERIPLGDDEADPRSAATAVLVAQARQLRRGQGAIRATVRAADSDVVWQAIVTAHGELFDATPAPGTARFRVVAVAPPRGAGRRGGAAGGGHGGGGRLEPHPPHRWRPSRPHRR